MDEPSAQASRRIFVVLPLLLLAYVPRISAAPLDSQGPTRGHRIFTWLEPLLCLSILVALLVYTLEIFFACSSSNRHKTNPTACLSPHRDRYLFLKPTMSLTPVLCLVLSLIGVLKRVLGPDWISGRATQTASCASPSINSDVAGAGIRVSFYVSVVTIATSNALGQLHGEPTGVKEMNLALLFNQISYTFNLLKGLNWLRGVEGAELSAIDALVGGMILDANVSILSATFSTKECLTAAKLWRIGMIAQAISLVVLALMMVRLPRFALRKSSADCENFTAFWWDNFDLSQGLPLSFWLYFILRSFAWIHGSWICHLHMPRYAVAKEASENGSSLTPTIHKTVYHSIPATSSTKYREWLVFATTSVVYMELTLRCHELQHFGNWKSWSQSVPLIVAIGSCVRWFYSLYSMFQTKSVERRRRILIESTDGWVPPRITQWQAPDGGNFSSLILLAVKRVCYNHPFRASTLRSADHARVECVCVAWKERRLYYSKFPRDWDQRRKGLELIGASRMGDMRLLQDLLEEDANVNEREDETNSSALIQAAVNGHAPLVELLIEKGADIHATESDGKSALYWAIRNSHGPVVKALVKRQQRLDAGTGEAGSLLCLAAEVGSEDITQILLDHGVDPGARNGGETPLHAAARNGHAQVVRLLLSDSEPNSMTVQGGETALHLAAENGHEEVVQLLVENGADATLLDERERSALERASRKGYDSIERLLFQHGAPLDHSDMKTVSLQRAAVNGKVAAVIDALERGADPNSVNKIGWTVLQQAAQKGHLEIVAELHRRGADINAKDTHGETAIDMAIESRHWEVVTLLQRLGAKSGFVRTYQLPGEEIRLWRDGGRVETLRKLERRVRVPRQQDFFYGLWEDSPGLPPNCGTAQVAKD